MWTPKLNENIQASGDFELGAGSTNTTKPNPKSKNDNPLNNLNLFDIVNHYKLAAKPVISNTVANNVTDDSNRESSSRKVSTELTGIENKISFIKELNNAVLNSSTTTNITNCNCLTNNKLQEGNNIKSTFEKLDTNHNFKINNNTNNITDTSLDKIHNTTIDSKTDRFSCGQNNTENGLSNVLVEQFSHFFDKYEQSNNAISDSGISENLLFDYEDIKAVEKIFLHKDSNNAQCCDDVFEIIANNENIVFGNFISDIDINEHFTSSNTEKEFNPKKGVISDSSSNLNEEINTFDSLKISEVFDKERKINLDENETSKETDMNAEMIVNVVKDSSVINDFPKILRPKLKKIKSTEIIDEKTLTESIDSSIKPVSVEVVPKPILNEPFTVLVSSDGVETIITAKDIETIQDSNAVTDEIFTETNLDDEYSAGDIKTQNYECDETDTSNNKALAENASHVHFVDQSNNNIDVTSHKYKLSEFFLAHNHCNLSLTEKSKVDISERPSCKQYILKNSDTTMNLLQNQAHSKDKHKIETNMTQKLAIKNPVVSNISEINLLFNNINIQNTTKAKNDKIPIIFQIIDDLKFLNKGDDIHPNNTQVAITTFKNDKKLLAKRFIKSDGDKHGFTKGPNLYEKTIVLPQILERLAVRKVKFDVKRYMKKRLILDDGSACGANKPIDEVAANRVKEIKTVDNFANTSNNVGINVKKKFKNIAKDLKLDVPDSISKNEDNGVKLNPEVLLEDCNRERVMELKKRIWLRNFVQ